MLRANFDFSPNNSNVTDLAAIEEYAAFRFQYSFGPVTVLRIAGNCVIMLVAIPSNLIVLMSIGKIGRARQSTFTYISKHLCIASLYIACITLPINTVWQITYGWYAGTFGCKFFMALRAVGFYMTAFLIVTLSINRYAIVKYQRSLYANKRLEIFIYILWAAACVASIPQVFAFGIYEVEIGIKQCALLYDEIDPHFGTYFNNQAYTIAHFTVCYALPVAVLFLVQAALLRELRQPSHVSCKLTLPYSTAASNFSFQPSSSVQHASTGSRILFKFSILEATLVGGKKVTNRVAPPATNDNWKTKQQSESQSNSKLLIKARRMTLRTSATMLGIYVACWTPHYVMIFIKWFFPDLEEITPALLIWALHNCAMMNCCFNPLVYGFMVPTIRSIIAKSIFAQDWK